MGWKSTAPSSVALTVHATSGRKAFEIVPAEPVYGRAVPREIVRDENPDANAPDQSAVGYQVQPEAEGRDSNATGELSGKVAIVTGGDGVICRGSPSGGRSRSGVSPDTDGARNIDSRSALHWQIAWAIEAKEIVL